MLLLLLFCRCWMWFLSLKWLWDLFVGRDKTKRKEREGFFGGRRVLIIFFFYRIIVVFLSHFRLAWSISINRVWVGALPPKCLKYKNSSPLIVSSLNWGIWPINWLNLSCEEKRDDGRDGSQEQIKQSVWDSKKEAPKAVKGAREL